MPFTDISNPLCVIVGPTAVGKTELSIQLAERIDGEIVSADSRLLYRGMNIGTAKPSLCDQTRVRHHLIDLIDPDNEFSLALYQAKAFSAIDDILSRNKLPILVGGTGQYIHAILYGWRIPTQKPNMQLRNALYRWAEEIGREGLHRRLSILDPEAARKIDVNNVRRTIRALEVIFGTGQLFSKQRQCQPTKYTTLIIGLTRSRQELYQRVDQRIMDMIDQGLIDEVKHLLALGYSPHLTGLSAIGYREMISYLNGEISLDEAIERMKRTTRRFIRHQANWFKLNDPNIHWFNISGNKTIIDDIVQFVETPSNWKVNNRMEN